MNCRQAASVKVIALRTGHHADRAAADIRCMGQAQGNRRSASADFQPIAGPQHVSVDAAESGTGVSGTTAEHRRQIKAAADREIADAAAQAADAERFTRGQHMAAPVGRRARLAGRVFDARREVAGEGDGQGRACPQLRAEQAHLQRHGLRRVAGQRIGDRQPLRIERARQRHA
jgi:hypothetical protein